MLLLSFFLPFLQLCSEPSRKEKEAAIEKAKQDSIFAAVEAQRQADSIASLPEQQRIHDSITTAINKTQLDSIIATIVKARHDSLKTLENKNNQEVNKPIDALVKKEKHNFINKIWDHITLPNDNSISGFGISIFTVIQIFDEFKLESLSCLLITLNNLLAIFLLLLFFLKKIKLSRIFCMSSLLFFIIAVFLYHEQDILWGFWVAFILNMIDLVLVNLILYKPAQE